MPVMLRARSLSRNSTLPATSATPGSRRRALRRTICSRSEEHTSELQSQSNVVCRLLLEKKNNDTDTSAIGDAVQVTRALFDPEDVPEDDLRTRTIADVQRLDADISVHDRASCGQALLE